MRSLSANQIRELPDELVPDRPGTTLGAHVLNTGFGSVVVDRWPNPSAALAECAGNLTLFGNHSAFSDSELHSRVRGFVETSGAFVPVLRRVFGRLVVWQRVVFVLPEPTAAADPRDAVIRRLGPNDVPGLNALGADVSWISKTWGGHDGLVRSTTAWGAFVGGALVSVACPFYVGRGYEDIGVATNVAHRGRGLSTACAAAVCREIIARGRRPTWTTATDNSASVRVARKLGMVETRRFALHVVGVPVPEA